MKRIITFLVTVTIISTSLAQQGINYKAIIKDNAGNVIASCLVIVQLSILQGVAETNVYTETHTPTTDANGLVILNIGEGTLVSGDYNTIAWESNTHALNVQVNTGGGLVDLGTTSFKALPYALQAEKAANVTGLEALDDTNGIGRRLKGRDPANYGDIGLDATDLSHSNSASTLRGATGLHSTTMGIRTTVNSFVETVVGVYNSLYTPNSKTVYHTNDRLIVIGYDENSQSRSNALSILKNCKTGIGTDTPNPLLHLLNATSTNNPQLETKENTANAGTLINSKNAAETTNRWTLFARTDNI